MPLTRAQCLMDLMWTQRPELPSLSLLGNSAVSNSPYCSLLCPDSQVIAQARLCFSPAFT